MNLDFRLNAGNKFLLILGSRRVHVQQQGNIKLSSYFTYFKF